MRHALWLALLAHFVLAAGYWLVTPALEAPREEDYVARASACARGGGVHDAYASVLALGLCAAAMPDLRAHAVAAVGPGALRLQHGTGEPRGTPELRLLAALRALSILLGACSVVLTRAIARTVFPATAADAVAVLTMACMPQFAFSHAVLWHGTLLGAAANVAILLAVRGAARGHFAPWQGCASGAAAGLAVWTAPEGWFAALVALLGHAFALRARPRSASTWASLAALLALGAAGALLAARAPALPPLEVPGRDAGDLLLSFVGEFGRGALPLPWPPLAITAVVIAASAAGWPLGAARLAASPAALAVLAASCSLGTVAGVTAALRDGFAGRALLVAFAPMAVLTGAGLVAVWRRVLPARAQPLAAHPAAALIPFLPSLLVLVFSVAPNARTAPGADPSFAILTTPRTHR